MAVIRDLLVQGAQMLLVLVLAPLLTGVVRKVKARLNRRRGASVIQPYRDLRRLLGKEVVLAENASWLFRVAPYLIFAVTWVAAALIPTFATSLIFSWSGDLIAITALLGTARFMLATPQHRPAKRSPTSRHFSGRRTGSRVAKGSPSRRWRAKSTYGTPRIYR